MSYLIRIGWKDHAWHRKRSKTWPEITSGRSPTHVAGYPQNLRRETQVRQPEFLEQYAATYRFSLGRPASVHITRAGDAVLFLRSGPRSFVRDFYEFDVATGTERLLASADKLLAGSQEELSDEEKARRERMRLAARVSLRMSYHETADGCSSHCRAGCSLSSARPAQPAN